MNPAREIWKRLLWREYREGRAAVLLAMAIPLLMLRPAAMWEGVGLRDAFRTAGALGVHLVILFWAVSRGDNRRKSADFELAHLPVSPMAALTSSFIVPALASAVVGAVFGWCVSPGEAGYVLAGAIDVMTTYVFGYYFSAVMSRWLGVLMGVTSIAIGKMIQLSDLQNSNDIDTGIVMVACAIGAGVGLFVFTRLIGEKPLPYRQLVSLAVVAAFGLFTGLRTFDPSVFHWTIESGARVQYSESAVNYSDSRARLEVWARSYRNGPATVLFQDNLYGKNTRPAVAHEIAGMLKTIGVRDRRYVYLAQQLPESSRVRIIVWDTPSWHKPGTVRELARFETRKFAIPGHRGLDVVSPDGSYALVTLNTLIGDGEDYWIVNLRTGAARVFKAAVPRPDAEGTALETALEYYWDISWTRDYALIPGKAPTAVDLKSMSLVPFKTPLRKADAR